MCSSFQLRKIVHFFFLVLVIDEIATLHAGMYYPSATLLGGPVVHVLGLAVVVSRQHRSFLSSFIQQSFIA